MQRRLQLLRRAQRPLPGRQAHGISVRSDPQGGRGHAPAVHDTQHDGPGRAHQVHQPEGGAVQKQSELDQQETKLTDVSRR